MPDKWAQYAQTAQPPQDKWAQFAQTTPQATAQPQQQNLGVMDTISGVAGKVGDFVKGVVTSPSEVLGNPMKAAASTVFNAVNAYNHTPQDKYRTPIEPIAMAAGAALGGDTPKMADAFRRKDYGAALVEATPLLAQAAAPAVVRGVGKGIPMVGKLAGKVAEGNLRPSGVQAEFVKEYQGMHPKAVEGVEKLFDAAAPTGMQKGARANLAVAAGDFAEIGQNIKNVKGEVVPLSDAKGGIINPDMRPQAVVDATRAHLEKMYTEERAPQIARNADKPVAVGVDPNAARGLDYLASSAGDVSLEQLAQKALDGKVLTVAEADKLAILANKELLSFEKMTPEGKTQARMTNPKIGGLKALDTELGTNLNKVLADNGEVGLRSYERRAAAVNNFLSMLEARKNAVELNKPGLIKKVVKPVAAALTGGKAEIASASQAAVSDVNIGRSLQKGFDLLNDSGIKPNRGMPTRARLPKR